MRHSAVSMGRQRRLKYNCRSLTPAPLRVMDNRALTNSLDEAKALGAVPHAVERNLVVWRLARL